MSDTITLPVLQGIQRDLRSLLSIVAGFGQRFDLIDNRLALADQRAGLVDNRLATMDNRLNALGEELALSIKVEMGGALANLETRLENYIHERFDSLETLIRAAMEK